MTATFSEPIPQDIYTQAERLMQRLCDRKMMICLAESCTGGLLAAILTDVEGTAHAFDRGFVTYTDEAKIQALGVPADLIAAGTAVSRRVAHAMAVGALERSLAGIALSITGFAGPGAPGEEPGLMYFGVAEREGPAKVFKRQFGPLSRADARIAALRTALTLLLTDTQSLSTAAETAEA